MCEKLDICVFAGSNKNTINATYMRQYLIARLWLEDNFVYVRGFFMI